MRLLFTLSILLLVGCTITKRHFGPGYHIEWKKAYSQAEKEDEKEKPVNLREDRPAVAENSIFQQIDSVNSNTKQDEMLSEETVLDEVPSHESVETETIKTTLERIEKKTFFERDEAVNEIQQKTEPLTWVSLVLLFVAGIALGMIAWYGSILFVGTGVVLTCLMIAMFVCSLISLIRIYRHPDRYKNKGLTHFLFSLSIVCLVGAAMYLIGISALASMSPIM